MWLFLIKCAPLLSTSTLYPSRTSCWTERIVLCTAEQKSTRLMSSRMLFCNMMDKVPCFEASELVPKAHCTWTGETDSTWVSNDGTREICRLAPLSKIRVRQRDPKRHAHGAWVTVMGTENRFTIRGAGSIRVSATNSWNRIKAPLSCSTVVMSQE